jgi:antitoxin ParD1/3/4
VYAKVRRKNRRSATNVSLTPELEKFVSAKVECGRYNSASEVVREALRLLEEHDQARAAQLSEFIKNSAAVWLPSIAAKTWTRRNPAPGLQRKSEKRRMLRP